MKTLAPKEDMIKRDWYVVDASDQVLGRLATRIASILRGKNKPYFSPHLLVGDNIIVINAEKIRLTGNKELQKVYQRYSGYPDGLSEKPYKRVLEEEPERIIFEAVKGMLPKNILGRQIIQNLKIYAGNEHPHKAQQPKELSFDS
ncbi:MAG: 50S ribosomal protein L13 [Candidatus Cloacimonetes bacterium]|jgi:large subunit ribosomal protein L13|nr:50S ribosomal protein L13 [Candidatus Cloacimonadota bacterium]MBT6993509.1 50S ribosomal protein L13 [Candidatus Cloacimonadota bacterium]MBT7469095.1 50S ribosomal protein L13 [Candidatus Cloacimonadota bacterium]